MAPPHEETADGHHSPATSFLQHFTADDLQEFSWQLDDNNHQNQGTSSASESSTGTVTKAGTVVTMPPKPPEVNPNPNTKIEPEEPDENVSQEQKAQARSERKRSREKQRRANVNQQFADLSALLRKIELAGDSNPGQKSSLPSTNNRVDLIARTIQVMDQLHQENKVKTAEIDSLKKSVEESKKIAEDTAARLKEATLYHPSAKQQVMMMVPMMVSSDGTTQTPGAAMPMAQSFMPQPMSYMQPSMTAAPGAPPQQQQTQTPTSTQSQLPVQMNMPMQQPQSNAPGSTPMFTPMMFPQGGGMAAPVPQMQHSMVTAHPQQQQQQQQQQSIMASAPAPTSSTPLQMQGQTNTTAAYGNQSSNDGQRVDVATAPVVPGSAASSPATGPQQQPQPQQQQQNSKWGVAQNNISGGNLAHCA
mmetsp:Transcript_342/g.426  ORF Transcript_342/g.426 Transcript_342/m.426 type:complete len:418 (+) Transcript_342:46-1299(+)|eukprot:CAMPEP_0195285428 /NCGR_PEP_ID=MMETSP0707-20130614/3263_1 /TAXON_ID=33640 /ORGANISM="Asterionellopsis glacialis, Strain CCMP134" /LENGTH=417 /DNA_ID=CAMNT_0040344917 /DNA_START=73 /DNA_END=1326 /DNA_ORIENTATION=+